MKVWEFHPIVHSTPDSFYNFLLNVRWNIVLGPRETICIFNKEQKTVSNNEVNFFLMPFLFCRNIQEW